MAKQETVSIAQACRMANVTPMTVYNWRYGRTGRDPLPYKEVQPRAGEGERKRVQIPLSGLRKWAKKYGVTLREGKRHRA